jgi:hypothetical protein
VKRHNRPLPNRSCQNEGDRALFEIRAPYVYDCTGGTGGTRLAFVQCGRINTKEHTKIERRRNRASARDSIKNPAAVDKILRHCQYFLLFPFGNLMCCVSARKIKGKDDKM